MDKFPPVVARQKRGAPILVCKKCLKRLPDGKSIKQVLKSQLRSIAAASNRKKPRMVLTSCVGICPKRAVVVTNGSHFARGEYLLIDMRSVESAVGALMPVAESTSALP